MVLVLCILSSRNSIASTALSCESSLRRIQTRLSVLRGEQQLLLTGRGALDIDGREDALFEQAPVERNLLIAGALELFEDDLVHPAAGIDQRGRDNRQAAAVLGIARGAENFLGLCSALESTPPERILPEGGTTVL